MELIFKMFIVVFIVVILLKLLKPRIKGYLGETAVAAKLYGLSEQKYRVINDVMIQGDYGTTQIDHVVISAYGIFVIETKNYKGWITGSEYGDHWTKNVYGNKYSFRNPLKQNYAHIKALEKGLGVSKDKFISIVAFSNKCDIRVKTNENVIYFSQLKRTISQYTDVLFQEAELDVLEKRLYSMNIIGRDERIEHIKSIKNNVQVQNAKIKSGICPKCGAQLVSRKGKYGRFIGCSNYPKCRYTTK